MILSNKEIARQLGISATAVSLARNNRPGVSQETRAKVMHLLNDSISQTLNSVDTTGLASPILFIIHKKHGRIIIEKPFFSELLSVVQLEASRYAYPLQVMYYLPEQNIELFIHQIKQTPCSGIILLATEMDEEDLTHYAQLNCPLILLDSRFDFAPYNSVTIDNAVGIMQGMQYAYAMGHRDIGYLRSSTPINNFAHRYDGYLKGKRILGLENRNTPEIFLGCSIETAYADMKKYLSNKDLQTLPSIFLCDLDYIAIGAVKALKEAGYSIPEDISILGFDDVPSAEIVEPALSTLRVNQEPLGKFTIQRLIQIMEQPGNYYSNTQVSVQLVERQSVRRLPV